MNRRASVAAVVAALVAGYGAADVADLVPGVLTRAPAPAAAPNRSAPPPSDDQSQTPAPQPLADLDPSAPTPSTQGLAAAVAGPLRDPALAGGIGLDIRDGLSGASLLSVDAERPRVPASTAKLLTAAAVAHGGDLNSRLFTRTVGSPGVITLVAGGDTLLAPGAGDPGATAGHAGLEDLAAASARALTQAGTSTVRLHLDDTYARGPLAASGWGTGDLRSGFTGPVVMLGMTTQRSLPGHPAPADPPLATAAAFTQALRRHGVTVQGPPTREAAPADGVELARVESAPLRDVLGLALLESDNALTEIVARSTAVQAGTQPTFPAVAGWVREQLGALGVPLTGVTLSDASGLSRSTKVPTRAVADVVSLAASARAPALAAVLDQLPVAGLTGTLASRYLSVPTQPAAGVARAKTGTLTGVTSLGGTVVDRDGRLLVYALIADGVTPQGTLEARAALDRVVAALAECGCQTPTRGTP
ncbi:D-alanyl-D-alanine carboxypeptidase/D-alanyl-D-alanine endopeptidase [Gephyromycinifex aptenodytis]|uniref:D-alanyl-D-alanine carboxypeptidase/D-alanyl-D-alanine endopeptidase n=1 Tax=Gephyromycinifex aptenodytis TaxID=2716227 RepID=UPI0014467854|nr:D-alanyl-D-alanine carboxypeptidase/D-alanyl-D-alanine-endopeptidase [Gephyromycinifex aptenodytis]